MRFVNWAGLTVNTLPPTTAAVSDGERRLFGGIRTPIGFRHPWLRGISSEIRHRRQYMIAEYVTASGALTLPILLSVIWPLCVSAEEWNPYRIPPDRSLQNQT